MKTIKSNVLTLMMRLYLFLGTLILLNVSGTAQVQYQMTYGGAQNDEARSAIITSDGYAISGSTNSFGAGGIDYYLLGTDTCGYVTLSKTVGGTSSEGNYDLLQSFAGRYVLYGKTNSFGSGDLDSYLTELNLAVTNVKTSWVVGDSLKEEGQAIVEAIDTTGFVGAGFTNSFGAGNYDVYVVKHRYNGTIAWTKVFGGTNLDKAYDIQSTSDGGYIVTGETKSFGEGQSDVYLLKLNSNGTLAWSKVYGTNGNDIGYSVKQILGGGYIITGYTELNDTLPYGKNIYLIKTDGSGNKIWSYAYGGTDDEEGRSVVQLVDSSFAVCGMTNSYGAGLDDAYLIKTTKTGTLSWGKTYGADSSDRCFCLLNTEDAGYLLSGMTNSFGAGKSDVYVIKTDNIGESGCQEDSGAVRYDVIDSVDIGGQSSSGGLLDTGGVLNSPTTLMDTICNSCDEVFRNNGSLNFQDALETFAVLYPNPANSVLNIGIVNSTETKTSIRIFDVSGKLIQVADMENAFISIDLSKFIGGIYLIEIENGENLLRDKFIKE